MKIQITTNKHKIYKKGTTMEVLDFLKEYFDKCDDKKLVGWLQGIPIPAAVEYIANNLGLTYKFI